MGLRCKGLKLTGFQRSSVQGLQGLEALQARRGLWGYAQGLWVREKGSWP